jgi:hypothetical protein
MTHTIDLSRPLVIAEDLCIPVPSLYYHDHSSTETAPYIESIETLE